MATYFGYVEREADSYINWADVGRNMSATIDNIQRVRDEKKALIEKAYREDLDFIQANPTGENKSLREKSIEFANSAAENLKLKYNMLKQGKASVKDFTSFRQNITDDTENLYGTLNKMQEEYKRKMDRAKAGDSQYLERRNMELLEQYDMSKTDLFVNGVTGAVTIGLMEEVEENGQKVRRLTKDPNKFISVNQYKAAVTEDYNNYDPLPALAGWVEQHGEVIESLRTLGSELQAGSILEVTDITGAVLKQKMEALGKTPEEIAVAQKAIDDWNAAKTAFYKSELANGYNFLAILTDQKKVAPNGKQYIPTYNIDDLKKGEEYVYIERNNVGGSVPTFEKHHEEDALEYLDLLTRPLLDKKVKMSTYTEVGAQKQQPQIYPEHYFARGEKTQKEQDWATDFGLLYYGSPEEKLGVIEKLYQLENVEYAKYVEDENGDVYVEIQQKDTNKKPARGYLIKDGKQQGAKNMTNALVNAALGSDVNAVEFKKRVLDNPLNPKLPEVKEPPKKLTFSEIVETKITPQINGNILTVSENNKNNTEMAASLNNIFGDTGITAKANGYYGITISYLDSGGKTVSKQFVSEYGKNQSTQAETEASAMRNFVNNYYNNLPTEVKTRYKQKFITGTRGELN